MEWITLVYLEGVADAKDSVECPTKRYKFISYMSLDFMSRIGKPLGCLIFFWVGEGLERRGVVCHIDQYKGGYGKILRKFQAFEHSHDLWKFS